MTHDTCLIVVGLVVLILMIMYGFPYLKNRKSRIFKPGYQINPITIPRPIIPFLTDNTPQVIHINNVPVKILSIKVQRVMDQGSYITIKTKGAEINWIMLSSLNKFNLEIDPLNYIQKTSYPDTVIKIVKRDNKITTLVFWYNDKSK